MATTLVGTVIKELSKAEALQMIRETPEQAADLLVALTHTVNFLMGRVEELTQKAAELEQRLAKNSSNSSKPPSSDGNSKPSPKSLRTKTGKRTGGQNGHPGDTLRQVEKPDEHVFHCPPTCTCGLSLEGAKIIHEERRQVFDIPKPALQVTEHCAQTKLCLCGHISVGQFPDDVGGRVQYGPNVKAMAVYLNQYHHLPYERTCEVLAELFGVQISQGTLLNILSECHANLEASEAAAKAHIITSAVANFDESGMRIGGKTLWVHSASTEKATVYHADGHRGADAATAAGILPHFKGTAIHDGWKPYFQFLCGHGLCNAHHLRELIFVADVCHQFWAMEMRELLLDIKQAVETARSTGLVALDANQHARFMKTYETLIAIAYAVNPWKTPTGEPRRGRFKKPKALNLAERLDKQRDAVLLFMNDFTVPFDNNLAERDIRMVKLKQKVSGGFRSMPGAEMFCRIRGYVSTARKNQIKVMLSLQLAFAKNPFLIAEGI